MKQQVGIEAIAVAIPRRYLAIEDLAVARGVAPAKYTVGLGALEMAVADPSEDTVALAATAATRLLRAHDIDVSQIGMLVVGTETGVDHSKPVASFVQGLLGLPRTMRTFDTQHACYGGTAALMAACDWIASGSAGGKSALVVCSDIARYGMQSAGEPTQGGAAVAMLVSARPELLAIDHGTSGVFSTDVHDFWRPIGRREAVVDGHYSIECYLEAVAGAYRAWRERATARGFLNDASMPRSEQLARMIYHAPFCKMARKAHLHVRRCELEELAGAPLDAAALAREEREGAASFDAQVAASLLLASRVGNTYTGSLYLGLASLLHAQGTELAGQRMGLFSYGSGCSSEMFSGVVGPRAAEIIAAARLDELLADRTRIDIVEYERIMQLPREGTIAASPVPGTFGFAGVRDDRRTYAGSAAVA
ncbi:MAG: Hydroxymethylglutaryl-CoA synthase [Labilithrix sp.]|nr:Hydroxymethylglutaryl-CoA synthase [Labilithrix sp.]